MTLNSQELLYFADELRINREAVTTVFHLSRHQYRDISSAIQNSGNPHNDIVKYKFQKNNGRRILVRKELFVVHLKTFPSTENGVPENLWTKESLPEINDKMTHCY